MIPFPLVTSEGTVPRMFKFLVTQRNKDEAKWCEGMWGRQEICRRVLGQPWSRLAGQRMMKDEEKKK